MPNFRGSWVPLPTPFTPGGTDVDVDALRRLVDVHLAAATAGLCPLGTTGEATALSSRESGLVLQTVLEHAAGRLPVVAGVGAGVGRRSELGA